jgi:hypothetical protein
MFHALRSAKRAARIPVDVIQGVRLGDEIHLFEVAAAPNLLSSFPLDKAGNSIAARRAMTTNSPIRVKPAPVGRAARVARLEFLT